MLDNTSTLCYISHHNQVGDEMIIFANVGNNRNLAQSLLLYTKLVRFCRKSASRFFPIILQSKRIRLSWNSAFSVNFCKFTELLQKTRQPGIKNKTKNQLRNQNAELHFLIPGPSFFAVHCITKLQKTSTTQKATIYTESACGF